MSDRYPEGASNYSVQPRYPYPQSPPMGALAAADSYSPTDWPAGPAELPDIGAPLLSPGPQVSAGAPWANRLVDTLTTPRQAEGDDTVLYKTASPKVNFTQADINRGLDLGLSFSGGGLGIKAYHGSPHDFDKFDLSKIGTGEGAQAYGHGLYFAENEGVAKSYRDLLATPRNDAPLTIRDDEMAKFLQSEKHPYVQREIKGFLDGTGYPNDLRQTVNQYGSPELRDYLEPKFLEQNPGHMYEVNINADPAHFLDWDKPLSQQHPQTQAAIKQAMGPNWDQFKSANAGDAVKQGFIAPGTDTTAARLSEAGIPGIKYFDQGSRGLPQQIEMYRTQLAKPGWSPEMRTELQGKLDALLKRPAPSSNYVVFNDKLIDILRKYGLAGAAPAGMGALAAQDNYQPQ